MKDNKTLRTVLSIVLGLVALYLLSQVLTLAVGLLVGVLSLTSTVIGGLLTLVFRFLLPLAIVGGIGYYLYKKLG